MFQIAPVFVNDSTTATNSEICVWLRPLCARYLLAGGRADRIASISLDAPIGVSAVFHTSRYFPAQTGNLCSVVVWAEGSAKDGTGYLLVTREHSVIIISRSFRFYRYLPIYQVGVNMYGNVRLDDPAFSTVKPFKHLMLIVTESCNLRCSYCYEKGHNYSAGKTMSRNIARQSVDLFLEQVPPQADRSCILFFGGEPHLAFDLIKQVVDYSYPHRTIGGYSGPRHNYVVNTNGTILNGEMFELYERLGRKVKLLVSVDGYGGSHDKSRRLVEGRGSWSLLEANLLRYRELKEKHGVKIGLTYTISKSNYMDISENYIRIHEMTGMPVGSLFVHEDNWTAEDLAVIRRQVNLLHGYCSEHDTGPKMCGTRRASNKKFQSICSAGIQSLTVNYQGDIYPCHRCYYNDQDGLFRLGDIRNGLNPSQRALISEINSLDKLPSRCRECPPAVWRRCHLCFAANRKIYGDFYRVPEEYCALQKDIHLVLRQGEQVIFPTSPAAG